MVVLMKAILAMLLLAAAPPETKPDRTVSIAAERFFFSPSRITVKQGTLVEFVLTSEDTEHGFLFAAASVNAVIPQQGKGELRVKFRALKRGKYPFECSRACGAGHTMMRGEVVVK